MLRPIKKIIAKLLFFTLKTSANSKFTREIMITLLSTALAQQRDHYEFQGLVSLVVTSAQY